MNNQSSLATSKQIERRPLNYATIDRRSQGYDNGQLGSARVKLGQLGIGENGFEYVPNISMLREKGARQKQEMRVHARKVMRIADFMAIFSQPCPLPSLPSFLAIASRTSPYIRRPYRVTKAPKNHYFCNTVPVGQYVSDGNGLRLQASHSRWVTHRTAI